VFLSPNEAVNVNGNSRLVMDGGKILNLGADGQPHPTCTGGTGVVLNGGSAIIRDGTQFVNLSRGAVNAGGTSSVSLDHASITAQYDTNQCVPLPSLKTLNSARLLVQNSSLVSNGVGSVQAADGIQSLSSNGPIVTDSEIRGYNAHGILIGANATAIQILRSNVDLNRTGIDSQQATGSVPDVVGSSIDHNVNGIIAEGLDMRTTDVSHNSGTGIIITGPAADLGRDTSSGLNTITDNTVTGVRFGPNITEGSIKAVGDLWNAGVQGANGFGFFNDPVVLVGGGSHGRGSNFILENRFQSIELGPVSIGRPRLTPTVARTSSQGLAHVELSWEHPVSWRALSRIELRLRDTTKTIGSIKIDPRRGRLTGRGGVVLVPAASHLRHAGKTITAILALRLPTSPAGERVEVDVVATDHHGHRQVEPDLGAIEVRN
jgi:hypothetical protein